MKSLPLVLPFTVRADYAEDKSTCYTYSSNLGLFAELRDENMPRDALIDKTLALSEKNDWSAGATLALIYMIQFVYANPEIKPAVMQKTAYDACTKNRGHQGA